MTFTSPSSSPLRPLFNVYMCILLSCFPLCVLQCHNRVYDGNSQSSVVIGTFCGIGRFPFSIVGTGTDLLLEFVSSKAGITIFLPNIHHRFKLLGRTLLLGYSRRYSYATLSGRFFCRGFLLICNHSFVTRLLLRCSHVNKQ